MIRGRADSAALPAISSNWRRRAEFASRCRAACLCCRHARRQHQFHRQGDRTILLASEERTADLVPPQAAKLCDVFLSTSRADRALAASARQPVTRSLWQGLERLVLPGIMAHYWHRKRWIEQWCRRGIADGCTRIVVLGAGFDTLGCRLAQEFSGLQVIEIDHPAAWSPASRWRQDNTEHRRHREMAPRHTGPTDC